MAEPEKDAITLAAEGLDPSAFDVPEVPEQPLDWDTLNWARWNIERRWQASLAESTPQAIANADREIHDVTVQCRSLGMAVDDPAFLFALQCAGTLISHMQATHVGLCSVYAGAPDVVEHIYEHVTDGLNEYYYWLRTRFIAVGAPAPHAPAEGEGPPTGRSPGTEA